MAHPATLCSWLKTITCQDGPIADHQLEDRMVRAMARFFNSVPFALLTGTAMVSGYFLEWNTDLSSTSIQIIEFTGFFGFSVVGYIMYCNYKHFQDCAQRLDNFHKQKND